MPISTFCMLKQTMASPFKTLSATTLLLLAVIIITMLLPECHADEPFEKTSSIHHVLRRVGRRIVSPKHRHGRPPFKPGPWNQAHATFYEGGSGTFGMNSAGLPSQIYLFFFFSC